MSVLIVLQVILNLVLLPEDIRNNNSMPNESEISTSYIFYYFDDMCTTICTWGMNSSKLILSMENYAISTELRLRLAAER